MQVFRIQKNSGNARKNFIEFVRISLKKKKLKKVLKHFSQMFEAF